MYNHDTPDFKFLYQLSRRILTFRELINDKWKSTFMISIWQTLKGALYLPYWTDNFYLVTATSVIVEFGVVLGFTLLYMLYYFGYCLLEDRNFSSHPWKGRLLLLYYSFDLGLDKVCSSAKEYEVFLNILAWQSLLLSIGSLGDKEWRTFWAYMLPCHRRLATSCLVVFCELW